MRNRLYTVTKSEDGLFIGLLRTLVSTTKSKLHPKEVLASACCTVLGIIHCNLLPLNLTINDIFYCLLLDSRWRTIREEDQRRQPVRCDAVLCHLYEGYAAVITR